MTTAPLHPERIGLVSWVSVPFYMHKLLQSIGHDVCYLTPCITDTFVCLWNDRELLLWLWQ